MKMVVEGIKLTKDHKDDKILYHKNGKYYVRKASDGFTKGEAIRQHVSSYFTKWGFRKVEGVAEFDNAEDIQANIDRFEPAKGYIAKYAGSVLPRG